MDIEFVCHNASFLQKANVINFGILQKHIDTFLELAFPHFDTLRIQHLDFIKDIIQVIHAAFQIASKVCAFLFAHFVDLIQGLIEFSGKMLF